MLVQTREQFEGVRTALAAAPYIVFDTETTGLWPHLGDRLCGIAVLCPLVGTDYHLSAYLPFRHKPGEDLFSHSDNIPYEWMRELMQVVIRPDVHLIAHHWKFDAMMLMYEGYDISRTRFSCTQVMSWLNCEWESHRLKDLHDKYVPGSKSKEREGLIKQFVKKEGSYDSVPPAQMEPYACGDVEDTYELYNLFLEKLDEQELTPLLDREFEFARLLFDMEWYGIGVDLRECKALSDEAVARMRQLEDEMGFDPLKNRELARRLCAKPPEGLGLIPDALTRTSSPEFPEGIPEMRQEWLSKHLDQPLVVSVIEYKGLVKANSTWFSGFQEAASKGKDGRLHTTFNGSSASKNKQGDVGKTGTVNGRLNSSKPNMQQIPREDEVGEKALNRKVKKLFLPGRQRWGLFEFDYKQIEVRLGAGYADADLMLEALRAGEDPHAVTAERIGCSRQTAKHATYTILYGGGATTLAATIERLEFQTTGKVITYDLGDAQTIMDAYFNLYPGFKRIQQEAAQLIRRRKYVNIWNGRRRHYEQWYDPNRKKMVDNGHKAFNSIIQGGAAEIIKTTMLNMPIKHFAYRMVSQVHDSLWVEIVNDFREDWIEEVKWNMEWPSRDERFKVPFDVDVKCMALEPFDPSEWEDPEERHGVFVLSSR